MSESEYKYIVRIVGNDIPGDKKPISGLTKIKGIGRHFAKTLLNIMKIDYTTNIGFLTDKQINEIEEIIKDPTLHFPIWFLNRRKDMETGKDMHIIDSDMALTIRNDIEREKTTNSWKGYRHTFGLKVRGQRTRCTGRKGGAVGVKKGGKVLPAKNQDQK
ncbi:MAG: 30S ribosomal protein S13 [Thaumarchaeota archaeon]|nr:30S ribosomal protein S13 [Nitrososphaerota archaeon]MCY3976155.1 30S ribosomal protein S13 [Nitrososphaerota archaeon]